jgi:hypothetical protein
VRRIFRGLNRLLPVRYRGEDDERYWEAYILFAATDNDEAERLFEAMTDDALGCSDEPDHECPHFRFASLRPLEEE